MIFSQFHRSARMLSILTIGCSLMNPEWAGAFTRQTVALSMTTVTALVGQCAFQQRSGEFSGFDSTFPHWRTLRSKIPLLLSGAVLAASVHEMIHPTTAHAMSASASLVPLAFLLRAFFARTPDVPRVELCDVDDSQDAQAMSANLRAMMREAYVTTADRSSGKPDDAAIADAAGATDDYVLLHTRIAADYSDTSPEVYLVSLPDGHVFFAEGNEYAVLHYDRESHAYYFSLNFLKRLRQQSAIDYSAVLLSLADYATARVHYSDSHKDALVSSGLKMIDSPFSQFLTEQLQSQLIEEQKQNDAAQETITLSDRRDLLQLAKGVTLVPDAAPWSDPTWELRRTAVKEEKFVSDENGAAEDKKHMPAWMWSWLEPMLATGRDWTLHYSVYPHETARSAFNHGISHAFRLVDGETKRSIVLGPNIITDDRLPFTNAQRKNVVASYEARVKATNERHPGLRQMLLLLNDPETVRLLLSDNRLSEDDQRQLKGFIQAVTEPQWYSRIDVLHTDLRDAQGTMRLNEAALERMMNAASLLDNENRLNDKSARRLLTPAQLLRGAIGWAAAKAMEGASGDASLWSLYADAYSAVAETLAPFVFKLFTMRQAYAWIAQHDLPYAVKAPEVRTIYAWGSGPDLLLRASDRLLTTLAALGFQLHALRFIMADFSENMLKAGAQVQRARGIPFVAHRIAANLTDPMPLQAGSGDVIESGVFGTLGDGVNAEGVSKKIHFLIEADRLLKRGGVLVLTGKSKPISEAMQAILPEFGFKVVSERQPRLSVPDALLRMLTSGESMQEKINHLLMQLSGGTYLIAVKVETLSDEKIRALKETSPFTDQLRAALTYDDSAVNQRIGSNGHRRLAGLSPLTGLTSLHYDELSIDDRPAVISRQGVESEYPTFEAALDGLEWAANGNPKDKKLSLNDEVSYLDIRSQWDNPKIEFFSRSDIEWAIHRMERGVGSQKKAESIRPRTSENTRPASERSTIPAADVVTESLWMWILKQETLRLSTGDDSLFHRAGRAPTLIDGMPIMPARPLPPTPLELAIKSFQRVLNEKYRAGTLTTLLTIAEELLGYALDVPDPKIRETLVTMLLHKNRLGHIPTKAILDLLAPYVPIVAAVTVNKTPDQAWMENVNTMLANLTGSRRLQAADWRDAREGLFNVYGPDAALDLLAKRALDKTVFTSEEQRVRNEEFLNGLNLFLNPRHFYAANNVRQGSSLRYLISIGDPIETYRIPSLNQTISLFSTREANSTVDLYLLPPYPGFAENSTTPSDDMIDELPSADQALLRRWHERAYGLHPSKNDIHRQNAWALRRLLLVGGAIDALYQATRRQAESTATRLATTLTVDDLLLKKTSPLSATNVRGDVLKALFDNLTELSQTESPAASLYNFFGLSLSRAANEKSSDLLEAMLALMIVEVDPTPIENNRVHLKPAEAIRTLMQRMSSMSDDEIRDLARRLLEANFRQHVTLSPETRTLEIEALPSEEQTTSTGTDLDKQPLAAAAIDAVLRPGRGRNRPGLERQRAILEDIRERISPTALATALQKKGMTVSPAQLEPILKKYDLLPDPAVRQPSTSANSDQVFIEFMNVVQETLNTTTFVPAQWPRLWRKIARAQTPSSELAMTLWKRLQELPPESVYSTVDREDLMWRWMAAMNAVIGDDHHTIAADNVKGKWTVIEQRVPGRPEHFWIDGIDVQIYQGDSDATQTVNNRQFGAVLPSMNAFIQSADQTDALKDNPFTTPSMALMKKTFPEGASNKMTASMSREATKQKFLFWWVAEIASQAIYRASSDNEKLTFNSGGDKLHFSRSNYMPFEKLIRADSVAGGRYKAMVGTQYPTLGQLVEYRDAFCNLQLLMLSDVPLFALTSLLDDTNISRAPTASDALLIAMMSETLGIPVHESVTVEDAQRLVEKIAKLSEDELRRVAQKTLLANFRLEATFKDAHTVEIHIHPDDGLIPLPTKLRDDFFKFWQATAEGHLDRATYTSLVTSFKYLWGELPEDVTHPSADLFSPVEGDILPDRWVPLFALRDLWQNVLHRHGYLFFVDGADAELVPIRTSDELHVHVRQGDDVRLSMYAGEDKTFEPVGFGSEAILHPERSRQSGEKTYRELSSQKLHSVFDRWTARAYVDGKTATDAGLNKAHLSAVDHTINVIADQIGKKIVMKVVAENSSKIEIQRGRVRPHTLQQLGFFSFLNQHVRQGSLIRSEATLTWNGIDVPRSAKDLVEDGIEVYKLVVAMTVPGIASAAFHLAFARLMDEVRRPDLRPVQHHELLILRLLANHLLGKDDKDFQHMTTQDALTVAEHLLQKSDSDLASLMSQILRENYDVLLHFHSDSDVEIEYNAPRQSPEETRHLLDAA